MDSIFVYRAWMTVDEEIHEIQKMIQRVEIILSKSNHCDYKLHLRAHKNYKRRLEVLNEQKKTVTKSNNEGL